MTSWLLKTTAPGPADGGRWAGLPHPVSPLRFSFCRRGRGGGPQGVREAPFAGASCCQVLSLITVKGTQHKIYHFNRF